MNCVKKIPDMLILVIFLVLHETLNLPCHLDPSSVGTTSSTEVIHVVDEMDTPTQEQHWGEILERTVSKQNLMLVNVGTNGTILNHQQTFPRFYNVEPIETKAAITLCCMSLRRCCFKLKTRKIIKISTHPCYPINVD